MWSARLFLAAHVAAGAGPPRVALPTDAEVRRLWGLFKTRYERHYADETEHFRAFAANVRRAVSANAEQGADCEDVFDDARCTFGVTKFSDVPAADFAATRLGYRPPLAAGRRQSRCQPPTTAAAGEHGTVMSGVDVQDVDWRNHGAVSRVKDQGLCGGCWAFSAAEEIESAVFMATGSLPTLSTQQLISCDKSDSGCEGGDPISAYRYVERAGGLDSEANYPDRSHQSGQTGNCSWSGREAVRVLNCTYATRPCIHGSCSAQDEGALAAALAKKGPVSVCVNSAEWQHYRGGIYAKECSAWVAEIDHCVQLVGLNASGPVPYWVLRNSWGPDWGMDGYLHLQMGKNLCGVANQATFAEVKGVGSTAQLVI